MNLLKLIEAALKPFDCMCTFLIRVPVSILLIALDMMSLAVSVISWHQVDTRVVLETRLVSETSLLLEQVA